MLVVVVVGDGVRFNYTLEWLEAAEESDLQSPAQPTTRTINGRYAIDFCCLHLSLSILHRPLLLIASNKPTNNQTHKQQQQQHHKRWEKSERKFTLNDYYCYYCLYYWLARPSCCRCCYDGPRSHLAGASPLSKRCEFNPTCKRQQQHQTEWQRSEH